VIKGINAGGPGEGENRSLHADCQLSACVWA
jgi:hypothetical protein